MGNSTQVEVAGKEVICRELTVAGVRKLISDDGDTDLANNYLFEDMRLSDIPSFTNLKAKDVEALRPSEIDEVVSACKKANPHFFAMLARLRKTQAQA